MARVGVCRVRRQEMSYSFLRVEHGAGMYTAGGLRGFWLGVGTTVLRAVVLGAANLCTCSTAKDALRAEAGMQVPVPASTCDQHEPCP